MSNTIKVSTKKLIEMDLPCEAIEDDVIDTSRWSEHHQIIFKMDDKHWTTSYSCGATEMQDEQPWQDEDTVEITEVQRKEVLVEQWVEV